MARVTVEDCLENVDNRFELVLLATKRARQLAHGQESKVPWGKDKPTVVALREIALNLTNMGNIDAKPVVEEPETELTATEEQPLTPPPTSSI